MKSFFLMTALALTLFCLTVVGLLVAQGRWNHEGTRHIPLLNQWFEAPADSVEPVGPARVAAASPKVQEEVPRPAPQREPEPTVDIDASEPASPNPLPELFDLKPIEAAGVSVKDVNEIVARVQRREAELKQQQEDLRRAQSELELRERDAAAREEKAAGLLNEVLAERAKVERSIEEFNQRVVALTGDEFWRLREAGRTLANLTPRAASQVVLDFWKTPVGQVRATKILAVMDPADVDLILGELDTATMRAILEKRMSIVTPRKKGSEER